MDNTLIFTRREDGNWEAIFDHYFHAIGVSKEQAAHRLWLFIKTNYPEIFPTADAAIQQYFASST